VTCLLSREVVLHLFAERSQIQTYIFVRGTHWNHFNTSYFTRFILLHNDVLHKIQYKWGCLKITEGRTKGAWGSHAAALWTVVENHWFRVCQAWLVSFAPLWRGRKNCLAKIKIGDLQLLESIFCAPIQSFTSKQHQHNTLI